MKNSLIVKLLQLDHGKGLSLPSYATAQSAGVDLCAAIEDSVIMNPGSRELIPTGIAIALPNGYEAQVRSRSGLSIKYGIIVLNAPGTIDADYRGEIKVPLINLGSDDYKLSRGDRIAQLVVATVTHLSWNCVENFSDDDITARGDKGFGSTGT